MQTILPPSGNTIKILGKARSAEHGLRWMHYVLAQPVDGGVLVQAFIPTAESIEVKMGSGTYQMEMADEEGFFAVLIPRKTIAPYTLRITYDNETKAESLQLFQSDHGAGVKEV